MYIWFTHANGDIDVGLYDDSSNLLDSGVSTDNNELVFTVAGYEGYYYILIYGVSGAENSYDMDIDIY